MKADSQVVERVKQAIRKAEAAAKAARDESQRAAVFDSRGLVIDTAGDVLIHTYESHTAVTRALKELGIVGNKDGGYYWVKLDLGFGYEQSINLDEPLDKRGSRCSP